MTTLITVGVTKRCAKCKQDMPISDFWKNKTHKDGFRSRCKFCEGPSRLEYKKTEKYTQWRRKYYQEHPWLKHLKKAWGRCNSPKHASYQWYGGKGVKMLLKPSEIKSLWQTYHADTMNHPNLDRINDMDPERWNYTPSNCRFVEREVNIRRSLLKRRATKLYKLLFCNPAYPRTCC